MPISFRVKPFSTAALAHTHPRDITLSDMHDVLDIVDQMMDLTFQDRLKISLELTAGHLDIDTQMEPCHLP